MTTIARTRLALAVALLSVPLLAAAQQLSPVGTREGVNPLESGYVFNIVDWDGGKVPRLYERSDQLPISLNDVRKLSANKFSNAAIIKMLEERRCICDASIDALVELKGAGVSEEVIQAVSLHSLPPNRSFGLAISLDFEGLGNRTVSTPGIGMCPFGTLSPVPTG